MIFPEKDNEVGIIIQARMGSSRLPGKVLKKIGSRVLLDFIFEKLNAVFFKVILATTVEARDNVLEHYCIDRKIACYRGNELNVLERYYLCANKYNLKNIVRLTADNPFVDVEDMMGMIKFHLDENSDYSNSFNVLPVGVGSEIFTFNTLQRSYLEGKEPHHIEHVNEYILENPDKFIIRTYQTRAEKNFPDIRLTVDTEEDLIKANYIVENCKDKIPTTVEAIEFARKWKQKHNNLH